MEMSRTATLLLLATHVSYTEAVHVSDPIVCYILDVILLLYSIIFTALYFRQKFTREEPIPPDPATPARNPNEPVYTDLDLPQINSDYQQLDRLIRRQEEETHYQELRGQSNEEYQEIKKTGTKPHKGRSKPNEARTGRKRDAEVVAEMDTFVASRN
ncbi:T-cell surface glycoprotein CD3 zeta chain-like isoform X2 [Myxocyprinus asiaticus]|uniref:T-cell surface glycoprotein CD3 zeta chain-like isoform X2 n=1 Tax=Myxocyprinus asiaticus TaxID=70543 RepID=UPI002222C237|nr:T-cell surface glycoprotein CD3 zeta chain-like isoform X2 [Myxocyprinus asiaticus]